MDKYNEKRKSILMRLNDNDYVDNKEIGMYELTPYFNHNQEDYSLIEKIMFFQNEEMEITHLNEKKCFMLEQYKALKCLEGNNRVILSAPTSFGKTLIVKEYIFKHKPKNVVYIVPTNALAFELEQSFKSNDNFSFYSIYDRKKVDMDTDNDLPLLFIGTQEKYLEIRGTLGQIDLFIIDEAYKLEESTARQRGYKLSIAFMNSIVSNSYKVFLLSPNATFEGFENYNFFHYSTYFNAVDKIFKVLRNDEFYRGRN